MSVQNSFWLFDARDLHPSGWTLSCASSPPPAASTNCWLHTAPHPHAGAGQLVVRERPGRGHPRVRPVRGLLQDHPHHRHRTLRGADGAIYISSRTVCCSDIDLRSFAIDPCPCLKDILCWMHAWSADACTYARRTASPSCARRGALSAPDFSTPRRLILGGAVNFCAHSARHGPCTSHRRKHSDGQRRRSPSSSPSTTQVGNCCRRRWTTTPYLFDFYKDMQRWSFNLQIFPRTAAEQLLEIRSNGRDVVQDRTIYEDAFTSSHPTSTPWG